jgi:DNA-binding IclR family transcriptional regulator
MCNNVGRRLLNRQSPQGIKSIEVAGGLLVALAGSSGEMSLTELARVAGMPPSKARRYLLSFSRIGLVEQALPSRRYELGPLALKLGFAAFGRLDVMRAAAPAVTELRRRTNKTVSLAVWIDDAPTVVLFEQSVELFTLSMRVGSRVPLLRSAMGRVFAAYLPAELIDRHIRKELASPEVRRATRLRTREDVRRLIDEVRRHGSALARGELLASFSAVGAPVFDNRGRIVAALAMAGHRDQFDIRRDGPNALAVKRTAALISARLGYAV